MFDEAIEDVNERHKRYGWFTPIPAEEYEQLISAFLVEADDSYSGGGFNAPCGGYLGHYEEYYFPGYEREAREDMYRLLSRFNTYTARIIMDLEEESMELQDRVLSILVNHIGNTNRYPDWDDERLFPILIGALSADVDGGLGGLYEKLSDVVTYDLSHVLENLISDLQG